MAAAVLATAVAAAAFEPPFDAADVRAWRNIPDVVRDAFVGILEYATRVGQTTQALSLAVQRKANESEVRASLSGLATNEQLTELARFVQKDVFPRLDQPCASHMALSRTVTQLTARMAQLESVVSAQDKLIQQLSRDVGGAAKATDVASAELASRAFVESAVHTATRGLATVADVEAVAASKADASTIELLVRDMHALNADLATRARGEEVASAIDARVSAATSAVRGSLQASIDACNRSMVELRRAIDGKAAKDDATTPAAWRAKVASITAAFDAKLSLVSREATEEAVRATEKRLADVIDAVNKKAYKSDVTAALATRVSVDDFDAAVRRLADASAVQDALRRKANAADVDGVKRALLDVVNAVMVSNNAALPTIASGLSAAVSTAPLQSAYVAGVRDSLAYVGAAAGAAAGGASSMRRGGDSDAAGVAADLTSAAAASTASATRIRAEMAALRDRIDELETRQTRVERQQEASAAAAGSGLGLSRGGGVRGARPPSPLTAVASETASGAGSSGDLRAALRDHASDVAAAIDRLDEQLRSLQDRVDADDAAGRRRAVGGDAAAATAAALQEVRSMASACQARVQALTEQAAVVDARVVALQTAGDAVAGRLRAVERQVEPAVAATSSAAAAAAAGAARRVAVDDSLAPQVALPAPPTPSASSGVSGRWVWKSRSLHAETGAIVWDVEAANTARDVLVWRGPAPAAGGAAAGRAAPATAFPSVVTAIKPGLYKLSIGVFAPEPPVITILVNGLPAVSSVPTESVATADGAADDAESAAVLMGSAILHKHPAGSIGGVTMIQFLALPAKAELSILYASETRGQGFMEVAKV